VVDRPGLDQAPQSRLRGGVRLPDHKVEALVVLNRE